MFCQSLSSQGCLSYYKGAGNFVQVRRTAMPCWQVPSTVGRLADPWILHPLLQVDMLEVQQKYGVPRGTVQGLQDRASRFASMVAAFCEKLGWYDMEALITKFQVGSQLGSQL